MCLPTVVVIVVVDVVVGAGENLVVRGGEVAVVLGYAAEAVQPGDHDAVEVQHAADLLRYARHAVARGANRIHTYILLI